MQTEVLIVGGGLSGLSLACKLEEAGISWHLIEASDALGGRILSAEIEGQRFDLGPSWFWPGQPRMERLVEQFGLGVFEQYSMGNILSEDAQGKIHVNRGYGSMKGSYRLIGGMNTLIESLKNILPQRKISINTPLKSLHYSQQVIQAETDDGQFTAEQVALAIPPRVIAETIAFAPLLSSTEIKQLQNTQTWMANHAKILAVYDKPYWREKGYAGDLISKKGPLAEVHDASPFEGSPYALFGFVGIHAQIREQHWGDILAMVKQQLGRTFGSELSEPKALQWVDWTQNPGIATRFDKNAASGHTLNGYPAILQDIWNGQIHLSSTEVGLRFGGYLEGALEAADQTFERITQCQSYRTRMR